jgi:hypothetical protein
MVGQAIASLNDESERARTLAARRLGNLGAEAKSAIPALTEALKDKQCIPRLAAAEALLMIDQDNADAVRVLDEMWKPAAMAYGTYAFPVYQAVARLGPRARKLTGIVRSCRVEAHYLRVVFDPAYESASSDKVERAMLEALRPPSEPDEFLEVHVTNFLKMRLAVKRLSRGGVLDPDYANYLVGSYLTVKALEKIGPEAYPPLVEMLSESKPRPRISETSDDAPACALDWLCARDPSALKAVVDGLSHRNPMVRYMACVLLPEKPAAAPALIKALDDPDDKVVEKACRSLGFAVGHEGKEAEQAIAALTQKMSHQNPEIREACQSAIARIRDEKK